jgi:peptidoglycan/LPS O-acetylase OafA/YrhL/lysophospholipase L1-like esterase
MQHRQSLDGLRGLAVAAVVVYHFAPDRLPGGYLGVDLFFVLSGFLITSLLLEEYRRTGAIDIRTFWIRRARRLLPAALITLLVIAALAAFGIDRAGGVRGDLISAAFYVNNWHQIAAERSYFDAFGQASATTHFWSLAIEEQFYVLFPLGVAGVILGVRVATRRFADRPGRLPRELPGPAPRSLRAGAISLALAGIAASSGLMWFWSRQGVDPSRLYYGTDTRAFEILIGVLTAVVVSRPDRVVWRRSLLPSAVGAGATCAWAMATWTSGAPRYFEGGALLWSLLAAVVLISLLPTSGWSRLVAWTPLAALGRISYGVYLVHYPLLVWLTPQRTGLNGVALFVLRVDLTLLIAIVSFVLLEQPIRTTRMLVAPRRALVVAVAAPLVVALAAWAIPAAQGSAPLAAAGIGLDRNETDIVRTVGSSTTVPTTSAEPAPGSAVPGQPAPGDAAAPSSALPGPPSGPTPTVSAPPPLAEATRLANESISTACWRKRPNVEFRDNGTGKLVAVIGDSVTANTRDALLNDRRFDWVILERCQFGFRALINQTGRDNREITAAINQVLGMKPQALIVALGVVDVLLPTVDPAMGPKLEQVAQRIAAVPCRLIPNLAPSEAMRANHPDWPQRVANYNTLLNEVANAHGIHVLDWAGQVASVPLNSAGYHPWLNPADGFHLLPPDGIRARIELYAAGAAGCFG